MASETHAHPDSRTRRGAARHRRGARRDSPHNTASKRPASAQSLFGRSLLYVVVGSLQLLLSSLISPVIAHLLSPGDFGLVALTLSIYQLLFILAVFGFDQVIVIYSTEGAAGEDKARRLLGTTILYSLVLAAAFAVSLPVWRDVVGQHGFSGVLLAGVIWVGPSAANAFILAMLRAQDRFGWFALITLLSAGGGQIIGVGLLLALRDDPVLYVGSGVVTQLLALLVGLRVTRPSVRSPLGASALRDVLRISSPVAASAVAVYVLNTSDRIVIARELGQVAVARYQIAYVVGSLVILMLGFISSAWLAMLLRLQHSTDLRVVANRSRDFLLVILMPVTLGIVVASPTLLRLVAPASYGGAGLVNVTSVVALSAFPVAFAGACARLLIASGRRAPIAWSAAAAGVTNIALNLVFVPTLGIFGSAIATLIAFTLQAVLLSTQTHGFCWPIPLKVACGILISAAAALASTKLPVTGPWLALRLVVGVALGVLGLALLPRARAAMDSVSGPRPTPSPVDASAAEPGAAELSVAESTGFVADAVGDVAAARPATSVGPQPRVRHPQPGPRHAARRRRRPSPTPETDPIDE